MKTKPAEGIVFTPSPHPNTYFASKANNPNTTAVVHPRLDDILEALHKKKPAWEFIGVKYHSSRNECVEFNAYYNDEFLGAFGFNPWSSQRNFYVDCRELSKHRQRGDTTQTGDEKKLVRLIIDNFKPLSLSEVVGNANKKLSSHISSAHGTHTREHNMAWQDVFKEVKDYVLTNWESFSKHTSKSGDKEFAKKLIETKRKADEAYNVHYARGSGSHGYDVVVRGNDYVVAPSNLPAGDPDFSMYSEEDLPNHIKVPLMFLKLGEPDVVVPGVGYRISDTEYFVIGEEAK